MNLKLNSRIIGSYKSLPQIARILTEDWVNRNTYCPSCGANKIYQYERNKPVADFYCSKCMSDFELKSKKDKITDRIVNGAYGSMIQRITSNKNPHFFFLTYSISEYLIKDFLVIPKHYFSSQIIEKRKPLSINARRSGWVGCNIVLNNVPQSGRIYLIQNGIVCSKSIVLEKWNKTLFLQEENSTSKGWLIEIMNCIDKIPSITFSLNDIYKYENHLKRMFPNNNFIKDKIRQQHQVLRDKGLLKFLGRGLYEKKINV
jgi:type II restriction enzyme